MSLDEIEKHLRRAYALMADDSVMFLWAVERYLVETQQIAERMGFKLHCRMIWDKSPMGLSTAFTLRFSQEYLLFMYKGKLLPVAKEERGQICSVFHAQPRSHSEKPEIAYKIIERLYPDTARLEMYARKERPGWDAFGNEIQTSIFTWKENL